MSKAPFQKNQQNRYHSLLLCMTDHRRLRIMITFYSIDKPKRTKNITIPFFKIQNKPATGFQEEKIIIQKP